MSTWDVERKEGKAFEDREVPPDGAIPARICAMIDIGTHDARDMKGTVYERKCLFLGFELGENDSKGNPFYMSKLVTLSLDTKATLYAIVKALHGEVAIGDRLDPSWIAGKPCLLQISHETKIKKGTERTYANIDSIGKPPRGTVCPVGSCVVWRAADGVPLPSLSHLPLIWNEVQGKMLSVREWVEVSKESATRSDIPSTAADVRMNRPTGKPATPYTQAEADAIDDTVPF